MRMSEIHKIAKKMGIKSFGKKKVDLIREIQEKEGNIPCFGTDRVKNCNEINCLWRDDCIELTRLKGEGGR